MGKGKRKAAASGRSRREFLALTAGAVSAPLTAPSVHGTGLNRPNILFVFTDQERHARPAPPGLSLPGHERLQRTGVAFNNHYIGATMCSSSRAVLLTGLQTPDNGIFENLNVPWVPNMSTSVRTIGHMLRSAGYYTAYKGKWHLTREFDQHAPDRLFTKEMEGYGFADYASPGDVVGHTLGGYQFDDLIADSAVTWLRRRGRPLNDDGKPWCLTLSLVNPHDIMYFNTDAPGQPVQDAGKLIFEAAPAPAHQLYAATWDIPIPTNLAEPLNAAGRPMAHREYQKGWDALLGHIPPEEPRWRRFNDFYVNSIRAVDLNLARLLNELDLLGMTERTVIVYTSDHGEMAGAHGLRNKGPFAYEDNIHVPFFIVHPDVSGGRNSPTLTSHIDVAPSLLAMAGVKPEQAAESAGRELPGKDFTPVLNRLETADVHAVRETILYTYSGLVLNDGSVLERVADLIAAGKNPKDPKVIADHGIRPDLKKRGTMRTVCDGRYKFSRYFAPTERNKPADLDQLYAHNDVELFDLEIDPGEMNNLAADKVSNEPLILAMSAKLEAAIASEIGIDNGREMPDFDGINWTLDTID